MHGATKGTKVVAGTLGDESSAGENLIGAALGAVPGAALYGMRGGCCLGCKRFESRLGKAF